MINVICAKTLRVFKEDQKKLLGVSLLCVLMSAVIMILSGADNRYKYSACNIGGNEDDFFCGISKEKNIIGHAVFGI